MTSSPTSRLRDRLHGSARVLIKELAAFGVIGTIAFVIDISLFTGLASYGALKAKTASTIVSTIFAYFGNRYLSFSHRGRTSIGRESTVFFGINLVTLAFSLLVIGLFVYPLGYDHQSRTVFVINIVTIGLGTLFRFWAYKRFVFLHPDHARVKDVDVGADLAQ